MYASMLTLRILHGHDTLYLMLSLRLTEVCKSVLLLCTDPLIRELRSMQLSRHVFTWLDLQPAQFITPWVSHLQEVCNVCYGLTQQFAFSTM